MTINHPDWCALAHYCSAMPASRTLPVRGEHRSEPYLHATAWGSLIATLVASAATGRAWLELRMSVHIPDNEPRARRRAALIAEEVDQAVYGAITAADIETAIDNDPTLAALIAATSHRKAVTQ